MNAIPILLVTALAGATPSPELVLVPEIETPEACFVIESIARVMALTPSVRVLRAPLRPGESLAQATQRLQADVALSGTRQVGADGAQKVSLTRVLAGGEAQTASGEGPVDGDLGRLLKKLWPEKAPPLPAVGVLAAANPTALERACVKDAEGAYAASGAAVGRKLPELVAPPPSAARGPLLQQWAYASALRAKGQARTAMLILKRVVKRLEAGELAPIWRRPPSEGSAPSAIDVTPGAAVLFDEGAFIALDLSTGIDRWRHPLGTAEPNTIDVGRGVLLVALVNELVAIDGESGKILWRAPLHAPAPEVATMGGRIFVAGAREVLAIERRSGAVAWRHDPLVDVKAGPALSGSRLVVPAASTLLVLEPRSGEELKRIDLGDEVSSPLAVTAAGAVWVMVGGNQVVLVEPETGAIRLRVKNLPGLEWPPAVAAEQLVAAGKTSPWRRFVAYLDPNKPGGGRRLVRGALPPVIALPDFSGIVHLQTRPNAVVSRDMNGRIRWRAIQRGKITGLSVQEDVVIATAGSRAVLVDRNKGTRLATVDVGEPIVGVHANRGGGAALVRSGAVYGLPSRDDPRVAAWLREARLELGSTYLQLGVRPGAAAIAKRLLQRDGNDVAAHALYARAQKNPILAAGQWHRIARFTSPGDPLQREAEAQLNRLIGMVDRVLLTDPIRALSTVTQDRVVLLAGDRAIGLNAETNVVVWSHEAKGIRAGGHGLVYLDERLVNGQTGEAARAQPEPLAAEGPYVYVTAAGERPELIRLAADAKPLWRQTFDAGELKVMDSSQGSLLIESGADERQLEMLDNSDGRRRWMSPLQEEPRGAWISGDRVLLRLKKALVGLDGKTGRRAFAVANNDATLRGVHTIREGWMLNRGRILVTVDRARGRATGLIRLSGRATHVVVADLLQDDGSPGPEVAYAALDNGVVVAVDLGRRRIVGRVELGALSGLAVAGSRLFAIEEGTGALLVLDAHQKLQARRPR